MSICDRSQSFAIATGMSSCVSGKCGDAGEVIRLRVNFKKISF